MEVFVSKKERRLLKKTDTHLRRRLSDVCETVDNEEAGRSLSGRKEKKENYDKNKLRALRGSVSEEDLEKEE